MLLIELNMTFGHITPHRMISNNLHIPGLCDGDVFLFKSKGRWELWDDFMELVDSDISML